MELRISKYDPRFRRDDGTYNRDEWTSFSDIGKQFADGILTFVAYRHVEDLYANAIVDFFKLSSVSNLEVEACEFCWDKAEESDLETSAIDLSVGRQISLSKLDLVIRLCLREIAWCKLRGTNHSYLHFGYDYYAYLGATHDEVKFWHPPAGIFAEPFLSPYEID